MSFENMKSETFSLQLPFLQVFLLVVPTRTSHFFSGQKSGRRASALSLLALRRL